MCLHPRWTRCYVVLHSPPFTDCSVGLITNHDTNLYRGFHTNLSPLFHPFPCSSFIDSKGTRKRKSRWGDARLELAGVSGLPTAIDVQGMSVKDLTNYTISLRLDEIGRKLRSGDVVPPERERFVCMLPHQTPQDN